MGRRGSVCDAHVRMSSWRSSVVATNVNMLFFLYTSIPSTHPCHSFNPKCTMSRLLSNAVNPPWATYPLVARLHMKSRHHKRTERRHHKHLSLSLDSVPVSHVVSLMGGLLNSPGAFSRVHVYANPVAYHAIPQALPSTHPHDTPLPV